MTKGQRFTLIGFALVIAGMMLFPPFLVVDMNGTTWQLGYGFLLDHPVAPFERNSTLSAAVVKFGQLTLQILATVLLAGAVFLFMGQKEQD